MKRTSTRLKVSFHHTPVENYRRLFHSVVRAGRYRIAPDFPMRSWSRPGHDLVLGIAGAGAVVIGDRAYAVNAGELVWVDCERHDVQWPNRSEPWEFLWVRVDSPQLTPMADALNVEGNPVFTLRRTADAAAVFRRIFKLLREQPVNLDAALHAVIMSLVAVLFDARGSAVSGMPQEARDLRVMPGLTAVLNAMRLKYCQRWTIDALAKVAGISPSQFFRRFHQATGSTPMNWLRRERINQAKRLLGETHERIRDIAERVGYDDPLYFSRDFKKLAEMSPRQYRQQESGLIQRS